MADKYKPGIKLGGTLGPLGKYPIALGEQIAFADGTYLKDYIAAHGGGGVAVTAGPGVAIRDGVASFDPATLTAEQITALKALLGSTTPSTPSASSGVLGTGVLGQLTLGKTN